MGEFIGDSMMSEPLGRDWRHPYRLVDILVAVAVARQQEQKVWVKLRGHEAYTYEVWPGGRNVAWQDVTLERRQKRAEIQPARSGPKEKNWVTA